MDLVEAPKSHKSVFARLGDQLYEVKIHRESGKVLGGNGHQSGRTYGHSDQDHPLLCPVTTLPDFGIPYRNFFTAARCLSRSKLYLLLCDGNANDESSSPRPATRDSLQKIYVFDTRTKSFCPITGPLSFKPNGILISAYHNLYHLESSINRTDAYPDPSFERYHPQYNRWDAMPPIPKSISKDMGGILGYAVYRSHILLSLESRRKLGVIFIAFDIARAQWHEVTSSKTPYPPFEGRAVVLGDRIYALSESPYGGVFEFWFDSKTYSISRSVELPGLKSLFFKYAYHEYGLLTRYMAHLGDSDFCLVQTACDFSRRRRHRQPMWITTFRIVVEDGRKSYIQTLHSTVRDLYMEGPESVHFSFSPDCKDYEPKGEEGKTLQAQERKAREETPVRKRRRLCGEI